MGFWQLSVVGATKKVDFNVFVTYLYQVVKSKTFEAMKKIGERVAINEQNRAEKTIYFLINTDA